MKLERAITDQTRLAICPPRGYVLEQVSLCTCVCVCERMEGVGIYGSAIMIEVFPLRELAGALWKWYGGVRRENEGSAAQGLREGQKHVALK